MVWVYLEALAALAILVGIVWWTMSARHDRDAGKKNDSDTEER